METCYIVDLEKSQTIIKIDGQAFKHIRALRLKIGDKIDITSGRGFWAETILESVDKNFCVNRILNIYDSNTELPINIRLAIGILDSSDRFEFAIEKAVELGVNRISPLITKFTQKKSIRKERLESKIISAMEQSKRAYLPIIDEPTTINEALKIIDSNSKIILADIDGKKPSLGLISDIVFFVGPEGGFSSDEIELIKTSTNIDVWKLANNRLRAETAAITALSQLNSLLI